MSRGLGKVEQRVLELLQHAAAEEDGLFVLVRSLAGQDPEWTPEGTLKRVNESDTNSTHRAVRSLAAKGLIETSTVDYGGTIMKIARLPPARPAPDLPRKINWALEEELHLLKNRFNHVLRRQGCTTRWYLTNRFPWHVDRLRVPAPDGGTDLITIQHFPEHPLETAAWAKLRAEIYGEIDLAGLDQRPARHDDPDEAPIIRELCSKYGHLLYRNMLLTVAHDLEPLPSTWADTTEPSSEVLSHPAEPDQPRTIVIKLDPTTAEEAGKQIATTLRSTLPHHVGAAGDATVAAFDSPDRCVVVTLTGQAAQRYDDLALLCQVHSHTLARARGWLIALRHDGNRQLGVHLDARWQQLGREHPWA